MRYREFKTRRRPVDIPAGEPRECISNALDNAITCDLRYAEGIAKGPNVGLWVRHAWNVDSRGRAIDPTWDEPTRYIGRVIPLNDKVRKVMDAGVYLFEDDSPLVPEGEMGIDCYTREQHDFLVTQGVLRSVHANRTQAGPTVDQESAQATTVGNPHRV